MNKTTMCRRTQGFTLVELMVVIAISAILLTLASPSMREFVGKWQTSNAINSFVGTLQLARSEAIKRGRIVRICNTNNGTSCVTGDNNTNGGWKSGWIAYVDNDASISLNAGDDIFLAQGNLSGMDNITSNAVGAQSFAFTPAGLMQNGVGSQSINFSWDLDGKIRKALCISFTGRTRIVNDNSDCSSNS